MIRPNLKILLIKHLLKAKDSECCFYWFKYKICYWNIQTMLNICCIQLYTFTGVQCVDIYFSQCTRSHFSVTVNGVFTRNPWDIGCILIDISILETRFILVLVGSLRVLSFRPFGCEVRILTFQSPICVFVRWFSALYRSDNIIPLQRSLIVCSFALQ